MTERPSPAAGPLTRTPPRVLFKCGHDALRDCWTIGVAWGRDELWDHLHRNGDLIYRHALAVHLHWRGWTWPFRCFFTRY